MSPELRSRLMSITLEMKQAETQALYESARDETEARYKLLQGFGTIGHARNSIAAFLKGFDEPLMANEAEENVNAEIANG